MTTCAFLDAMLRACAQMPAHQQVLCAMDLRIGDGDHGVTIARGFGAVGTDEGLKPDMPAEAFFLRLSDVMMNAMGGAIGPVYGLLWEALGKAHAGGRPVSADSLADGFAQATARIGRVCAVGAGDKTVFDAMLSTAQTLDGARQLPLEEALALARDAAHSGRDATADMMARKGRARYLQEKSVGIVDPGAASFALWLDALLDAVEENKQ